MSNIFHRRQVERGGTVKINWGSILKKLTVKKALSEY